MRFLATIDFVECTVIAAVQFSPERANPRSFVLRVTTPEGADIADILPPATIADLQAESIEIARRNIVGPRRLLEIEPETGAR
jgi:hypothetical protein